MAHALVVDNVPLQVPARRHILAGINLSVAAGERLAIVGPNSAGKTCLLRLIHGLVRPTSGRIPLYGEPVQAMPTTATMSPAIVAWPCTT